MHKRLVKRHIHVLRMKLSLSSRLSSIVPGYFRLIRFQYPKIFQIIKKYSRYFRGIGVQVIELIRKLKDFAWKFKTTLSRNPNYRQIKKFLHLEILVLGKFLDLQKDIMKQKHRKLSLLVIYYGRNLLKGSRKLSLSLSKAVKTKLKRFRIKVEPIYIKTYEKVLRAEKLKHKIRLFEDSILDKRLLSKFRLQSFSLKQGIAIASVILVLFIIQTQLYRTQIITERSTQVDFVNINGGSTGDLNFDFNFDSSQRSDVLKNIIKPVISVGKVPPIVVFEDYSGNQVQAEYKIVEVGSTGYSVTVTPKTLPPGEYRAKLGVYKDGIYFEQQQRFVYGVLAVNTNKATYLPGEMVNMHMAALRNDGHTICDADLDLIIVNPKGVETKLDVYQSGKCLRNNVTDVPDYSSLFQTEIIGEYKVLLSNKLNGYKIEDSFHVVDSLPFSIERLGPTRIYPFVPYDFRIKVKANEAYHGSIVERVPKSFVINRETSIVDGLKEIKWDVNLAKGEEAEFIYSFDAPDVSPELYFLGHLEIGDYKEARQWQIAGDADQTVVFTTPGSTNWTIPAGVTSVTVETWGAGGGGKGGTVGLPGGGGGGGAYSKEVIAVTPSTSFNVVVGTGGTAGSANGGNGGNGGSSSFSANTTNTTANGGSGATTTSGGTAGSANGNADFSYAGGAGGNGHQNAVTHVGSASAGTTSVTFPTHQKGDLMIIMAFRDGSATLPTIPAGWIVLETSTTTSASSVLAYKVANNSSETSGTWTSATELAVQIYRGHAGVGIWGGSGAVSSIITYPLISLTVTDGTSWVAGFAAHRSATNVEGPPWGMTNKTSAGSEIAGHDTNGGVASWPLSTVVVGASSGWLSWVVEIKAATTSTALSYVGSATGKNTLTMPAHQVGDLLMMFAYRDGNVTAPTVPTGWRVWGTAAGANLNSSVGAYKIAKTTSETSGTWTNATALEVQVYRGHGGLGGVATNGGASTTVTYGALTMGVSDGSSWVAGFAGHTSVNTTLENAPSGMTNKSTYVDAVSEIAGHDTSGGVTSWSDTNVSVGGTSSGWRARTVEIKAAVQGFGAGGGASSAGTGSAGTTGNNNSDDSGGGTATAPTGGGNGGAGGNDSSAGTNGSAPGGAGGGGGNLSTSGNGGGAGANGKVTITYSEPVSINVLGSCKQSDQTTNCTDVGTVRVAINGDLETVTQPTVGGTWTISGVNQPENGDIITVFIDGAGETDEAVAVTTYDGSGDIDGLVLIAQRLSIGNVDNRTVTNANLALYDNSISGDEDIFHEVDGSNDLTMIETSKPLAELYIKTGNTYRPASDNTGNITVNDFEIPSGAIFTADGNTITLSGDGTPLVVAGTLNEDTSTFKYSSTSTTTITPETYYHLSLQPSGAGGPTYTLGNATFNTRNLLVGDGTNAVTINWTANDPAINVGGNFTLNSSATWTKSNSASLTFNGATSPVSLTDNNTTKQDLGRLIIDGTKEVDIGSSITTESVNVTAGDTLDLQSSTYTLKITGSGTTTGRPFIVAGTLTEGNSTVEYTSTSATDIDDDTYYNLYLNQTGTTFTANGNVDVSNVFTINAGTFNAGANTITLSGSSTPFVVTGTFTEGTSTINYSGTTATNITADTYHNLQIGYVALGSSVTYTMLSGFYNVINDLDVGFTSGSGTATLDVNANDATVDITSDLRINTKGLYSASSNSAAPLTVGGDFSNNGTFTHNNGKVAMDGAVDTSQSILGTVTFYTLEIQTGDREIKLGTTGTKSIGANGSLTLTGSSCENMTRVRSSSATTQATLAVDASASASVSHVDLQDINLTTKTITASNSTNSGNNSGNWTISPNACLGTSNNSYPTGSSFQKKVIYDDQNSRYWMFNHDGDEIEVKYSSDEGSTWTNPSTAASGRLPYDTNDFSIWWKSISTVEYVVIAVADGGDIKLRQGTLSGTDITWDTDVSVALNEAGTYSNPYIVFDSADHIWVGATYNISTNYVYKTILTTQAASEDPSTWTWTATPFQISNNQTNSNVYGTISALSNEDMYATFVVNTNLLGCRWDDTDSMWEDGIGDSCTATMGEAGGTEYFDSLETNLVGYWKMNEASWNGTSGQVLDSTASSDHATSSGNATTTAAGFSRSGSFDGTGDYVTIPNSTQIPSQNGSLSAWVYPIEAGGGYDIAGGGAAANDFRISPANNLYGFYIGGEYRVSYSTDPTQNTWTLVTLTWDQTNGSILYYDGAIVASNSTPPPAFNQTGFQLGAFSSSDLQGRLDDVRLYDRALSAEEVAKLYQIVPESVNIDDGSDFGTLSQSGRQLIRTNNGAIYTFLNDGGNCEMWKSVDGINWSNTDSETCAATSPVAAAIDSAGDIHTIYSDTSGSNLVEWAEYSTSSDTFGTPAQLEATSGDNALTTVAISVDASDVPHAIWSIFSSSGSSNTLYYRNRTSGAWQTVRSVSADFGSVVNFTNIDILINDNTDSIPEVSFIESISGNVSWKSGNANNATTFSGSVPDSAVNDTIGQTGVSSSIDQRTGEKWITYVDDATSYIALAHHNGTSWSTITTKTDVGFEPSIAIAGSGEIYVFYQEDSTDQKIVFDIYNGSGWVGETVLHSTTGVDLQDVKAKWSFEWNNYGANKIDYVYSDGTDVYYDQLFLRPSPTNIDDASDFGSLISPGRQIVRTSSGGLYSFINDGGNCEIWKSTDNGVNWTIQDSADDPACNKIEGMAIDSTDKLHLVYSINSPFYDLLYIAFTTTDNQFGTQEIIRNYVSADEFRTASISLDETNIPHVVYILYSDSAGGVMVNYDNRVDESWNTTDLTIETVESNYSDITIDEDNIPIISYANNVDFDLTLAVGDQNDATSFTLHDVDTDINVATEEASTSLGIDSDGNTWVSYVRNDGSLDDITLAKRSDGNETSSWSTGWTIDITDDSIGFEPSLYINGTDIYVFYEDEQNDIVYEVYDGSSWSEETILEMHGALQDVNTKWSYINNYDSTGTAPIQTNTYYFDGNQGISDPGSAWATDSNAFDADLGTEASSGVDSTVSSNYLKAVGTTAPIASSTIDSVKVRMIATCWDTNLDPETMAASIYSQGEAELLGTVSYQNSTISSFSDYATLATPTGGWTWTKVSNLETKIHCDSVGDDMEYARIYYIEVLVMSSSEAQAEIDYLYSDGLDVFYNRLVMGTSTASVQDNIASGLSTGVSKNITSVGHTISTVDYIHLAYVNSSGNIYYDLYDGDWDFTASSLDSDTDNTYLSLSLDTLTNDAYLGYIASGNDDIYMKKATYSAGPSWSWGTSTVFKTDASEIYTNYNSNYSGSGKLGSIFTLGDLSPFNLDWEVVLSTAANNAPTVTSLSVNGGANINLTENSTVDISWTATITDDDGYAQIAGVIGKFYKSNVSGLEACTNDNNDCYEDTSCNLTSCTGDTCTATCTSAIYFHAEATDANSGQSALYWRGWMEATDSHSDTGVGFSAVDGPDINSLAALDVVASIDYGLLIPNDNSAQQSTLVTNTGNVILDTELSGDDMCVDYPTCASYSIDVGQQEYSMTGFTYGSGTDLTTTDSRLQLNLSKSTSSPANSTTNLYWRLGVPAPQALGEYSGQNVVTAVNDNL